jgi:hypothetical protein
VICEWRGAAASQSFFPNAEGPRFIARHLNLPGEVHLLPYYTLLSSHFQQWRIDKWSAK